MQNYFSFQLLIVIDKHFQTDYEKKKKKTEFQDAHKHSKTPQKSHL